MPHLSDGFAGDLRAALAAEAASAQRYAYFAQIAEIEGHAEIARLFTELADSLSCAVHGHLDVLREATAPDQQRDIGDTALNLASSVAGALHDAGELYPRLTADAHEEGHADVASWLTTLTALKKRHTVRLDAELDGLARASGDRPVPVAPLGGTDG